MRDRGLTHNQLLAKFDRELEAKFAANEREHQRLRAILVEKYGEEGVRKVEEKIKQEK